MKTKYLKLSSILLLLCLVFIIYCSDSTSNNDGSTSITISNPIDGDTLSTATLIQTEVTDKENIEYVTISIDSVQVLSQLTEPYQYRWVVLYWADGEEHTINATAHVLNGDPHPSDEVTVLIPESASQNPELLSPPDNSTIPNSQDSITFQWTNLDSVFSYELLVAKDNQFDSLLIVDDAIFDTTYSMDSFEIGTYFWKVRAENLFNLYSKYSQIFSLSIEE